MLVTLDGIAAFVNPVQEPNAESPMLFTPDWIVAVFSPEQR